MHEECDKIRISNVFCENKQEPEYIIVFFLFMRYLSGALQEAFLHINYRTELTHFLQHVSTCAKKICVCVM
jgi:hypothetical protein